MRAIFKSIITSLPPNIRKWILFVNEKYLALLARKKETSVYKLPSRHFNTANKRAIKNILIYHISGMFYAGTEKNLQLIANQLVDDYRVFYMYSKDNFSQRQKNLMDSRITFIEFTYDSIEKKLPYFIHGMNPHIKNVIHDNAIDFVITSSGGRPEYPINVLADIPIIMINVFGSPSLQKNITATIFISKTILDYSEKYTGKLERNSFAHLPVLGTDKNPISTRDTMRGRLGFTNDTFVFGRIGRGSDSIFDPIGINAFKEVVKEFPEAHYLIMSPPPILEKIVKEESIPNVHFMRDTEDIWDFYFSLDALAHFRLDGETFGLNIAEAMYAKNPIISHVSHVWNAHLEYLRPAFSRITEKDDVSQYIAYMKEYIILKKEQPEKWEHMRNEAHKTVIEQFNKERYGNAIKKIIQSL
jgi:glycosyltransferase involved in cell wall biosynthesis